jgi:hypothetical protein
MKGTAGSHLPPAITISSVYGLREDFTNNATANLCTVLPLTKESWKDLTIALKVST